MKNSKLIRLRSTYSLNKDNIDKSLSESSTKTRYSEYYLYNKLLVSPIKKLSPLRKKIDLTIAIDSNPRRSNRLAEQKAMTDKNLRALLKTLKENKKINSYKNIINQIRGEISLLKKEEESIYKKINEKLRSLLEEIECLAVCQGENKKHLEIIRAKIYGGFMSGSSLDKIINRISLEIQKLKESDANLAENIINIIKDFYINNFPKEKLRAIENQINYMEEGAEEDIDHIESLIKKEERENEEEYIKIVHSSSSKTK